MNEMNVWIIIVFAFCLITIGYHLFKIMSLKLKESTFQIRNAHMKYSFLQLDHIIHSSVKSRNIFMTDDGYEEKSTYQSDSEEIFNNIRERITGIADKNHLTSDLPIVNDMDEWIDSRIQFHAHWQDNGNSMQKLP